MGECGLDYHYDHSPRDAQRAVFAAQIALAHEHDLALVIHTREAWDDTFDILEAEGVPDAHGVPLLHRGPDEARAVPRPRASAVVQRHRHLQDGRRRCGPPARSARSTACWSRPTRPTWRRCPIGASPNRPALVPLVGAAVAEVKGVSLDEAVARAWPDRPTPFYRLSLLVVSQRFSWVIDASLCRLCVIAFAFQKLRSA